MADDNIRSAVDGELVVGLDAATKTALTATEGAANVASASIDGTCYGYPYRADNSYMLFYDSTIVSDEQAKTIEGVLAACKTASAKFAFAISNSWYGASPLWAAGGTETVNSDGIIESNFATAAVAAGGQAWADLYAANHDTVWVSTDSKDTILAGFTAGATTKYGAAVLWNAYNDFHAANANVKVTKLPTLSIGGTAKQMKAFVGTKEVVLANKKSMGYYISKGFFDTISKQIDEAAMVDGASRWQIFYKITLPLSKPIVVYTALTSFMKRVSDMFIGANSGDGGNPAQTVNYVACHDNYTLYDHLNYTVGSGMNGLKKTSVSNHLYYHYLRYTNTAASYADWDVWAWPFTQEGYRFDWAGRTASSDRLSATGDAVVDDFGGAYIDINLAQAYDGGWDATNKKMGGTAMSYTKKDGSLVSMAGFQIVKSATRNSTSSSFWVNDGGDLTITLADYALTNQDGTTSYHVFVVQDKIQSPLKQPSVTITDPFANDDGKNVTYGDSAYSTADWTNKALANTSPLFLKGDSGKTYLTNGAGIGYQIMVARFTSWREPISTPFITSAIVASS